MATAKALQTYLTDHLAGSVAGSELANKVSSEYAGTVYGAFLAELAAEIEQDKESLEQVLVRLGIEHDPIKQAAGWMLERLSRLKLIGAGSQELKRLLEFEALSLGIEGKLSMWRALIEVSGSIPQLAEVDLAGLAKRAETQRSTLEEHRLQVARAALTG